jgi:ribosome biogenesis GTPase
MPRIDADAVADEWDDDAPAQRRGRPEPSVAARAARRRAGTVRVVALDRGRATVVAEDGTGAGAAPFPARYGGALRGARVAVGDRVRVSGAGEDGPARLVERLPRGTVLRRTADDLDHRERVVAANVDLVAVVVGCDNLAAGLRFADRALVAAADGGLPALLVVTKSGVIGTPEGPSSSEVDAALAPYAGAVEGVLRTSIADGSGMGALRSRLADGWTVLTGHSGVGKSSLVNALVPAADREVGEVGARGGRHTTVAARALALPDGGMLVDTPGVRSLGLGMLDRPGLARCFPELAGLRCTLDDCRHAGEPGCGLPGADLHPVRRAAFERLAAALEGRGADAEPDAAPAAPDGPA